MTRFESSLQDLARDCSEYNKFIQTKNAINFENFFDFQRLQQEIIDKAMILCISPDWKEPLQPNYFSDKKESK